MVCDTIYTSVLPPPSALVQVITITSTHTAERVQPKNYTTIPTYSFCSGQNNLILNRDKTTCTLFSPDPTGSHEHSGPQHTQQCTTHENKNRHCTDYGKNQV